jgi:hypothetical protein
MKEAAQLRRGPDGGGDGRSTELRWQWHAPSHRGQLSAVVGIAYHRGRIVGENAGHRWQVADVSVHHPEERDDRGLGRGD